MHKDTLGSEDVDRFQFWISQAQETANEYKYHNPGFYYWIIVLCSIVVTIILSVIFGVIKSMHNTRIPFIVLNSINLSIAIYEFWHVR